jgi:hypothetical protein
MGPARPPKVMKNTLGLATALYGSIALPFVIPSEAEGSAVPRTRPGNVFRPSVAEWTYGSVLPSTSNVEAKPTPGAQSVLPVLRAKPGCALADECTTTFDLVDDQRAGVLRIAWRVGCG